MSSSVSLGVKQEVSTLDREETGPFREQKKALWRKQSGVGFRKMGFEENEGAGECVEWQECRWDMHEVLTMPNWLCSRVRTGM